MRPGDFPAEAEGHAADLPFLAKRGWARPPAEPLNLDGREEDLPTGTTLFPEGKPRSISSRSEVGRGRRPSRPTSPTGVGIVVFGLSSLEGGGRGRVRGATIEAQWDDGRLAFEV